MASIASTIYGNVLYFPNDQWIGAELAEGRMWEQAIFELTAVRAYVEKAEVALDIGAHVGCHSLMWLATNPTLKVHAFEPQTALFDLLRQNLQKYAVRVKLHPYALSHEQMIGATIGQERGVQPQYGYGAAPVNFGGASFATKGERVPVYALDDLGLDRVDFMKIDVEGAEHLVLEGARETLLRCKPVIMVEQNWKRLDEPTLRMLGAEQVRPVQEILRSLAPYQNSELQHIGDHNYLVIPK